jgi:hypothetical protein
MKINLAKNANNHWRKIIFIISAKFASILFVDIVTLQKEISPSLILQIGIYFIKMRVTA